MTALAAKDTSFTSTPTPQGPSLISNNTIVQEPLQSLHPNSIFPSPPTTSTSCPIAFCVANPMVVDGDVHHHHDSRQPVDLAILQAKITQTFASFSAFLNTLGFPPRQTDPMQPTLAMTSVTNDDNVPHPIGCQKPADDNNISLMYHT